MKNTAGQNKPWMPIVFAHTAPDVQTRRGAALWREHTERWSLLNQRQQLKFKFGFKLSKLNLKNQPQTQN